MRVDTGVREGDEISPYYDPMIAKLIVHAEDRAAAVRKLHDVLGECEIAGVTTNVAFLRRVLAEGTFARGDIDTGLIARRESALLRPSAPADISTLACLAAAEWHAVQDARAHAGVGSSDRHSPWQRTDGWWLNSDNGGVRFEFRDAHASYALSSVTRRAPRMRDASPSS